MIKQLLEWEYHFRLAKFADKVSKEEIYQISASSLATVISLFYIFPIILIIMSLVLYKFNYQIKINKWLGAIPPVVIMMIFYFILNRNFSASIYMNEVMSSDFDQGLANKMKIVRFVGAIFFLCVLVFCTYLLRSLQR